MNFLRGILTQNVVLMVSFFFAVLFVLVIPRSINCDGIGSKSQICKFDLGFPRIEQNVEVLIRPKYFGELLLVLSRHKLSCEQVSSPLLPTTFLRRILPAKTGTY